MAPAFSTIYISRMRACVVRKTEEWIKKRLEPIAYHGQAIDITHEILELTLTVIMETAFQYTMSAQERELPLTCLDMNMREYIFPNPMKGMIDTSVPREGKPVERPRSSWC
jgi:cytochrome P450